MSFKNLSIAISYSTRKSNPIEDFFKPVLSEALAYDVAVGYFSTAWIRDNSFGIARFASNGGKARWIISPYDLSSEDRALFIEAYRSNTPEIDELIKRRIVRSFDQLFVQLQEDARIALAWLIQDGIVEFKMGIPYADEDERGGILHSKMGYFRDVEENELSFSGSYNLTGQAKFNWERFDVFKAWDSSTDALRTRQIRDDLENMWNGNDETIMIFRPSEEALKKFKTLTGSTSRPYDRPKISTPDRILEIPTSFLDKDKKLRDYQEKAIVGWWKQNGRGIFHMAMA